MKIKKGRPLIIITNIHFQNEKIYDLGIKGIFDGMITIQTDYNGELRTSSLHVRSGSVLITDAPIDNEGKGEAFSPTDLLATSLGTCMVTTMGIAARKNKISIDGAHLEITKIMNLNPRLVSEVRIKLFMPDVKYSTSEKDILEHAALNCPVALSLHPELKQVVEFIYK